MASLESQLKKYASSGSGAGGINSQLTALARKAGYDEDYFKKKDEERAQQEAERQMQEDEERLRQEKENQKGLFDKAKDVAGAVAEGIAQPFQTVAQGTARALGATEQGTNVQQSAETLDKVRTEVLRTLQDPAVPESRKQVLRQIVGEQSGQEVQQAEQTRKQIESETNKRKFVASAYDVGLTPFALSPTGLTRGGTALAGKARIGQEVVEGVGFGALGAAEQDELTARNVATGAAIGTVLPLTGAALRNYNFNRRIKANTTADNVLGEYRQLPANATRAADVITDKSRLLEAGRVDPRLAVMSRGADINDVKRVAKIEQQLRRAQLTSDITADEARKLLRERESLVNKIQNPNNTVAKEINDIDSKILDAQKAGRNNEVVALGNDRTFLEQQSARQAQSGESAQFMTREPQAIYAKGTRARGASRTTEAKAIAEELSNGFDGIPTYQTMNLEEQAQRVVNVMDADYDFAKRVAMGEVPAPEGIQASSFYKGVESRAVREGDTELIERLATQSQIPKQATEAGQFNAALAYKDPESPVTAIRSVQDARKNSVNKIPREVSKEESTRIIELSQKVADAKSAIVNGGDRYAYGKARVEYDNYVQGLIQNANKKSLKESLKTPVESAVNVAGVSKSLRASLDNSALLRQGWKTLFTSPGTWAKNSAKSFVDWVRAAGGKEVIDEVRSDIVSRPNSLNGMYKKMGVDVFGITEEAFPTSLPEKIPVGGRLFKGSEAAYTAFQQRTRADLADKYLEIAQRSGVDLTSKKELQSLGKFVNSLTGRGDLGRVGERASKALNNVFFSPRLLKSNIDVLTAHQFQKGVSPFVRKQAARNLLQIAIGSAAALKLASEATGGKVEWDPRSSNFGKVQIGDTRFDLTGGMASIATLGARLATRSSKSSTTGEVNELNSGEFGAQTTLDTVYNFFENKTSPAVAVIRDYLKGETFEGKKPTIGTTIRNLTEPLIISSYEELKNNPRSANILSSLMAEGLGISVNTYGLDQDWNANNGKKVNAFKDKVSEKSFNEANTKFNERFTGWYDKISQSGSFWKLSQDERRNLVTSKKNALTDDVLAEYGYEYKSQKKSDDTKGLIEALKNL